MKRELLDILTCPVCKGCLEVTVIVEDNREIIAGSLKCSYCQQVYHIDRGIPDLMPPDKIADK